jgi:hypothetical protein
MKCSEPRSSSSFPPMINGRRLICCSIYFHVPFSHLMKKTREKGKEQSVNDWSRQRDDLADLRGGVWGKIESNTWRMSCLMVFEHGIWHAIPSIRTTVGNLSTNCVNALSTIIDIFRSFLSYQRIFADTVRNSLLSTQLCPKILLFDCLLTTRK